MRRLYRTVTQIGIAKPWFHFINWFVPIILCALVLQFVSCSKTNGPAGPTNHPPETPVLGGLSETPANGSINVPLVATLSWSATDPDGDQLTYMVCLGTIPSPNPVTEDFSDTILVSDSLEYGSTYYWSVAAKDPAGESAISEIWSFTTVPEPPEEIYQPDPPDLPSIAIETDTIQIIARSSGGNLGHFLDYQFDWGDESMSEWGSSVAYHSWDTAAIYPLRVRARCHTHTDVLSDWSNIAQFNIQDSIREFVSVRTPSGPDWGLVNTPIVFSTRGGCSWGHDIEVSFSFYDHGQTGWSESNFVSYEFTRTGYFYVAAYVRCARHPEITSQSADSIIIRIDQ